MQNRNPSKEHIFAPFSGYLVLAFVIALFVGSIATFVSAIQEHQVVILGRLFGGIAGLLGQSRKAPFQVPGQRMDPEERAIQKGQPLDQRVAPAGVLALVGQHGFELLPRPLPPTFRQDHGGAQPTHSDRRGALRTGERARVVDGGPHQPMRPDGADRETRQQHGDAEQVKARQARAPVPDSGPGSRLAALQMDCRRRHLG